MDLLLEMMEYSVHIAIMPPCYRLSNLSTTGLESPSPWAFFQEAGHLECIRHDSLWELRVIFYTDHNDLHYILSQNVVPPHRHRVELSMSVPAKIWRKNL